MAEQPEQPERTAAGLPLVEPDTATGRTAELLADAHAALGLTSNLIRTMANSPAATQGYLDFAVALRSGTLPLTARLCVGLLVAQELGDDYCLSSHTYVATRLAGLDENQVRRARSGEADDPVVAAALTLASALLCRNECVTAAETATARRRLTAGQVVEVAAHVGVATFVSRLAKASSIPLDWPAVHHTDLTSHTTQGDSPCSHV